MPVPPRRDSVQVIRAVSGIAHKLLHESCKGALGAPMSFSTSTLGGWVLTLIKSCAGAVTDAAGFSELCMASPISLSSPAALCHHFPCSGHRCL